LRKFIWKILRKLRLAGPIQLIYKGILDETGWLKSFNAMQSIDKSGNPIPWCSYSFIYFIEQRLSNDLSVFEFGAGNSTLWYAKRVKEVISVEHDLVWKTMLEQKVPSNSKVIFKELSYNGEYARTTTSLGRKFDVIVVDGRDRNNCIYNSIDSLSDKGVIILDNSQRTNYNESQKFLLAKGFKRIDFTGLCPAVAHINTTTIFYRTENCLGI
jgi:hypothetical protein